MKCGHGSCTVKSTPPFYECKCKPPYRPPDCKKGAIIDLKKNLSQPFNLFISCFLLAASPCRPNPCQNGGTCMKGPKRSSFQCSCPDGYSGTFCEVGKSFISRLLHWPPRTHLTLLNFSFCFVSLEGQTTVTKRMGNFIVVWWAWR